MILETQSENTEENARWALRYAHEKEWKRILLITSSYHMRRAKLIFEKVFRANGSTVEIETLSFFQEPYEPGEWMESFHGIRTTIAEYLKMIYYRSFWAPANQPPGGKT